ncbi:hypothetical protein [Brevibacterium sp. 'Marine']|uniref:MmyB family transcriptional regulator n=1 Tax=Brevibacterium sp. 'Marine' TaxID=2725563 RepID=UPI00145FB463|nr:hypothetical protein [Brevibacterium sp. 'Marine']
MTTQRTSRRADGARPVRLRSGLRAALDAVTDAPAAVLTDRLDVVAVNGLGRALLAPVLADDWPNMARFLFLDEDASTAFYPDWDRVADEQVHRLRTAAARDPHDRALHRLIGQLSTTSGPFRSRWSAKRHRGCCPPRVVIDHPVVGRLDLTREELTPTVDTALTLQIATAEAATASAERLGILASWALEAPGRV